MRCLFIIDPINRLKAYKDSSVAIMRSMQKKGIEIYIAETENLFLQLGAVTVKAQKIVLDLEADLHGDSWYTFVGETSTLLKEFTYVLMRKDPPFDLNYFYATHLLSYAVQQGANVINHPDAIRHYPEKLSIYGFPQYIVPSLVTSQIELLREFISKYEDVIVKPLDGMGGTGVFRIQSGSMNIGAILETLTQLNTVPIMAQRYIPEITQGDQRVLIIDGEPMPYVLARMPNQGEVRANLAAGGTGIAQKIRPYVYEVAKEVGKTLAPKGLFLIGLDMIGDYITEINVTSPTCFVEIEEQTGYCIADYFVGQLLQKTY